MGDNNEFGFDEGDRVLVRVRENGNTGNIVAKFQAECTKIRNKPIGSPTARLELPFGTLGSVSLRPYEAEFEVMA